MEGTSNPKGHKSFRNLVAVKRSCIRPDVRTGVPFPYIITTLRRFYQYDPLKDMTRDNMAFCRLSPSALNGDRCIRALDLRLMHELIRR